MKKTPSPDVEALMQRLQQLQQQPDRAGGRGRRSPLAQWLLAHADELRPTFDRRPSWTLVAEALPDIDETKDGRGARPNGQRLRKAWHQIRQIKGWVDRPPDPPPSAAPPASTPHVTARPSQPAAGTSDDDEEEIVLTTGGGKTRTVKISKR